jgi:cysteine synthase B
VLLDASSGNTAIAYAMLGAAIGFEVALCVPSNASPERLRTLRAYGARPILTDPLEGTDGAILEARRLAEEEPERYWYADQYGNPANWRAHYEGTALEVWQQTGGGVTHFVAGLGTTGTLVGVGRRLRELGPRVRIVGVEPAEALHGIEGLKNLDAALRPAIFDADVPDERLRVTTEEAQLWSRRLAREHGLFVGVSSGAAYAACRRIAERLEAGMLVTVLPDGGARYLSEEWWTK